MLVGVWISRAWRQSQPPPQIDGGDDLPAQVDQSLDDLRGLRHVGHLLEAQHFLHAENIHAEKQVSHKEC
jgi:hypothetical protein